MAIPYAAFLTLIDPLFYVKFEKDTLALLPQSSGMNYPERYR